MWLVNKLRKHGIMLQYRRIILDAWTTFEF